MAAINIPISFDETDRERMAYLQRYYSDLSGVRVGRSAVVRKAIECLFLSVRPTDKPDGSNEGQPTETA